MAEIITTVEDVKVVAEGSNAYGPWTKTAVVGGDGNEYATFDGVLASKASGLKGQTAKITFESTTRGKYTNLVLKDIEAVAGATPVTAPAAGSPAATKNDQFRTKEELRRTAAFELAVTSFGIAGLDPVAQVPELYELVNEFELFLSQADAA